MSRSATDNFLVGQFRQKIPDSKLPTNRDVLKFMFPKKSGVNISSEKPFNVSMTFLIPLIINTLLKILISHLIAGI